MKKLSTYFIEAGIPVNSKFLQVKKEDLRGNDPYLEMVENIFKWDFEDPSIVSIISKWNGCGKTHISVCLLKSYINNSYIPLREYYGTIKVGSAISYEQTEAIEILERPLKKIKFKKEYDIYYEILSTYQSKSNRTEADIIDYYCDLDFLVIDDLFSTKENEFARRVILTIIDKRVDWLCKPTVITSNKTFDEINDIDPRIASRITNKFLLEIESKPLDYRNPENFY